MDAVGSLALSVEKSTVPPPWRPHHRAQRPDAGCACESICVLCVRTQQKRSDANGSGGACCAACGCGGDTAARAAKGLVPRALDESSVGCAGHAVAGGTGVAGVGATPDGSPAVGQSIVEAPVNLASCCAGCGRGAAPKLRASRGAANASDGMPPYVAAEAAP